MVIFQLLLVITHYFVAYHVNVHESPTIAALFNEYDEMSSLQLDFYDILRNESLDALIEENIIIKSDSSSNNTLDYAQLTVDNLVLDFRGWYELNDKVTKKMLKEKMIKKYGTEKRTIKADED